MDRIRHCILIIAVGIAAASCSSLRYVEYDIIRPPQVLLSGNAPIAVIYNMDESGGEKESEDKELPDDCG